MAVSIAVHSTNGSAPNMVVDEMVSVSPIKSIGKIQAMLSL